MRDTLIFKSVLFKSVLSVCWFKDKQIKIIKRSFVSLPSSF
jgi:hypothetical protein